MDFPPLDVLEHWMQSVLTGPVSRPSESDAKDFPAIAEIVTPSRALSAEARLAIYSHAYFARLLECLRSEFPAVRQAAGDEAFAGFAAGYLAAFPSRSYTLGELG